MKKIKKVKKSVDIKKQWCYNIGAFLKEGNEQQRINLMLYNLPWDLKKPMRKTQEERQREKQRIATSGCKYTQCNYLIIIK